MTHFILLFCIHIRAKVDLIYKWDLQLFYFMDWLFFCIEVYNICIFFAINSMHGKKKLKKTKGLVNIPVSHSWLRPIISQIYCAFLIFKIHSVWSCMKVLSVSSFPESVFCFTYEAWRSVSSIDFIINNNNLKKNQVLFFDCNPFFL